MLGTVSTFDNGLAGLITECKAQLVIANIPLDLVWADLWIHKYNSRSDEELFPPQFLASFWAGTPFPSACTCVEYVDTAMRNKTKYKEVAQVKETIIPKQYAGEIVELLRI